MTAIIAHYKNFQIISYNNIKYTLFLLLLYPLYINTTGFVLVCTILVWLIYQINQIIFEKKLKLDNCVVFLGFLFTWSWFATYFVDFGLIMLFTLLIIAGFGIYINTHYTYLPTKWKNAFDILSIIVICFTSFSIFSSNVTLLSYDGLKKHVLLKNRELYYNFDIFNYQYKDRSSVAEDMPHRFDKLTDVGSWVVVTQGTMNGVSHESFNQMKKFNEQKFLPEEFYNNPQQSDDKKGKIIQYLNSAYPDLNFIVTKVEFSPKEKLMIW